MMAIAGREPVDVGGDIKTWRAVTSEPITPTPLFYERLVSLSELGPAFLPVNVPVRNDEHAESS